MFVTHLFYEYFLRLRYLLYILYRPTIPILIDFGS